MASTNRLRMFAGPNGSGKSKLFDTLAKERSAAGVFHGGPFINADELEKELRESGMIDLERFANAPTTEELAAWLRTSSWKSNLGEIAEMIEIAAGKVRLDRRVQRSYFTAAVADFLRERMVRTGRSFSFETVMSHQSKITFLVAAQKRGYRTYLYFVATEFPEINVFRVNGRVQEGGHSVPPQKIHERYHRSIALLPLALPFANRAYLFDNSTEHRLIAEVTDGDEWDWHAAENARPAWCVAAFSQLKGMP